MAGCIKFSKIMCKDLLTGKFFLGGCVDGSGLCSDLIIMGWPWYRQITNTTENEEKQEPSIADCNTNPIALDLGSITRVMPTSLTT
jgi:hypothetical protein